MPQSTNLNVAPFNDDYDPTNQYMRILFRPSVPVQARELTQLQSMLQNQIEEFGLSILDQGTVVRGCTFTFVKPYPFVKLKDAQVDGQPVNVSAFANGVAKQLTNNLTASIFNYESGFESQSPNLNTLYVNYTNAGDDGSVVFANGAVLEIYSSDYAIQSITINDGGTGYHNADILVFTSADGTGAAAGVVTDANGTIINTTLTAAGNNYIDAPTVTVANSTAGTANGSGANIVAINYISQVTVATNASSTSNTRTFPTGQAYGFRVTDGVIFNKGFFIFTEDQEIIVSKYDTSPSNVAVGFTVVESIVNNSIDTSLNDNATGTLNEGAPGAYRLKLEPTLHLLDSDDLATTNNFVMLAEFENGVPVRQRQDTFYGQLGKELAKRTSEESGSYVVKPFKVRNVAIPGDANNFLSWVSSGIAYIDGYRIEQFGQIPVTVRKGTDVIERKNQTLSMNYGNYVLVNELAGNFPFNTLATLSIRDAAAAAITSGATSISAPGNEIGTATLRNVVYDSGVPGTPQARYRVYVTVHFNNGKRWRDALSFYYAGSPAGIADVIFTGQADASGSFLHDHPNRLVVFPFGKTAIKTLADLSNTFDISYTYRTNNPSVSFANTGLLSITTSGNDYFPYTAGSTLNDIEIDDIIVMTTSSANASTTMSGTVNVSSSSNTVLGNSTAFLTELAVGDYILANTEVHRITVIANNTSLQTEGNWTSTGTTKTYKRHYPIYRAIPLEHRILTRTVNVDSNANTLTVSLGEALNTTLNCTITYNVNKTSAKQLTKTLLADQVVKLSMTSSARAALNRWSLGVPDVLQIKSVTKTTNADYVTDAVDVTSHFRVLQNDSDVAYRLSQLVKKPSSTLSVANGDKLVVTFDVFRSANTGGGAGFYSVDSYPVDDTSRVLPTDKIRTESIPSHVSVANGNVYDLRNCIDFRPQAVNTAVYTSTLASATVNPSNTETFSTTEVFAPAPDAKFYCDFQFYVGRIDKLIMNASGQLSVIEGAPSETPYPPSDPVDSMVIATLTIPPYPSLTTQQAKRVGRVESIQTSYDQVERLTMRELNNLQQRVESLEYYTSLNLLEQKASNLTIPSAVDPTLDRFKHGIFVDTFADFSLADFDSPEYKASIDTSRAELVPSFHQFKVDFKVYSLDGVELFGDTYLKEYDSHAAVMSNQSFATRTRNPAGGYWRFRGKTQLTPSYDHYFDTRVPPDVGTPTAPSPPDTTNTHAIIPINTVWPVALSHRNNYRYLTV